MSENDMLVSILNTLPMGIMYCSKDHEVLFINKEYAKIIGKEIVDIQGKPVTEVIPNSRVPIVLASGKSEWGDISVVQNARQRDRKSLTTYNFIKIHKKSK